jgi:imidazolonepropionase-like amidohydrolase
MRIWILSIVGSGSVVGSLLAQTPPTLAPAVRQFVSIDAPVVALTHVRLIDGTGGPVREDQTVVLANGRIQSVGNAAGATIPTGAQVLDLTGHTVIPGLVGLHDHMLYTTRNRMVQISSSASKLYLATGVTTVRTTGALQPYDEITQKAQIERGAAPGPRMHITGPHISGGAPLHFGPDATINSIRYVSSPEEARRTVAYWADEGADWIKVYTGITRAQLAAVIDEAHKHGLRVTGHLCSISFAEATELGIDNVEHGLLTNTEFHPAKTPDTCPADGTAGQLDLDFASERVQATFRNMVKKGVAMTSTLVVFEPSVPNRPPLEDRVLDAMAPDVRAEVLSARAEIAALPVGPAAAHFKKAMAYELAFVRAGGLLAAGSDPTGYGTVLPGFGDQRNYELLLEAGFTPVEAIQIQTSNGAKVLHESDRLGTVTAGKLADLVVIRGNPVANPADIRNVTTVFKDGVGYDSAKLIASVRGLVGIR